MIKLMNEGTQYADGTCRVEFFADTKDEATTEAIDEIYSLDKISMGSTIYTKDLNVATFDSDKSITWKR